MNAALNATQVGELTGYRAKRVFELTHLERFPAPIDPTLHPRSWRWSPNVIEQYVAGQWRPTPQLVRGAA